MFEKRDQLAEFIKEICDVATTHLPLNASLIAYELLLNLYVHQQRGEQITIKMLFGSIPYSDMGIRYHLRKLIEDGWLELIESPKDKRTRICAPTAKFDSAWAEISHKLERHLSDQ